MVDGGMKYGGGHISMTELENTIKDIKEKKHTKHIHNIQQQNNNYTQTHSILFIKQFTNMQHIKQADPLTEKHKTYKDTTLHSPFLRSKRL